MYFFRRMAESVREDWQSNQSFAETNRYMWTNKICCDVVFHVGKEKTEVCTAGLVCIAGLVCTAGLVCIAWLVCKAGFIYASVCKFHSLSLGGSMLCP